MRRNYDFIVFAFLSILGFVIYFWLEKKSEVLLSWFAVTITLFLGMRQYRIENDKVFKELFISFNDRYDRDFNNKLIEIETKSNLSDTNKALILDDTDKIVIIDYLNLCAEEYLWYKKGRIPKDVWIAWENGMIHYFNIQGINEIVIKEKSQDNSYYGLFSKIEKRIKK